MRFTAALILSVATALALPRVGSAGQPVRMLENHFGGVAASGETVVVTGNWMLASSELSPSRPSLAVKGGDLVFAPGAKFQTDDFGPVEKFAEGAFLWKVVGGKVSGLPQIDPPSMTNSWALSVSSDGLEGRIVRIHSSVSWLADFGEQLHRCFVVNQRWKYITNGLAVTLKVALCAVLLGVLIGFLVAIVRATHDKNGRFPVLNFVMKVYLTVIRGTPMAVQLLIAYFIIFASCNNKTLVAILAFGLNSGAYVAEIMRAGIVSIDPGQLEAGRSLGLSYSRTMLRIILPQAIRNVLPALGNEFIVLLKDTSIASFIALQDLAKGGEIIRSQTYNVYIPFLMVAAVYLVLVVFFTWLLGKLERHLRNTGADVVGSGS